MFGRLSNRLSSQWQEGCSRQDDARSVTPFRSTAEALNLVLDVVDMLAYAIDNPPKCTMILISGDRDFAYALSVLRLRRYRVVLVTLSNAHASLTSQASLTFDWNRDVIAPLDPSRSPSNRNKSNKNLYERRSSFDDGFNTNPSFARASNWSPEMEENILDRHDTVGMTNYVRAQMQHGRRNYSPPTNPNGQSNYPFPTTTNGRMDRTPRSWAAPLPEVTPSPRQTRSSALPPSDKPYFNSSKVNDGLSSPFKGDRKEADKTRPWVESCPTTPVNLPMNTAETSSSTLLEGFFGTPVAEVERSVSGPTFYTPSPQPSVEPPPMQHLHSTSGLSGGVNLSAQASQEKTNQQSNTPPTPGPKHKPLWAPPALWPLVLILRSHRVKGSFIPLRSQIAVELSKKPIIYKNAGVTKFSQYLELAVKEGLVEIGGANGTEWIRLVPKWYGA